MSAGWPVRLVATSCSPLVGVDDDVDLVEERGHLLNGEGAGAVGLDVFNGGIEAGDAEGVGPVFGALLGEQLVAAGQGEVVEGGGGFGGEQRGSWRRRAAWGVRPGMRFTPMERSLSSAARS